MRIDLGHKVFTSDGHALGNVTRLILDPTGQHVKSAVVEHGLILKDAFEVPASAFVETEDGKAHVDFTSEQARELPIYDDSRYTAAPPALSAPFGFPAGGIIWPVATPPAAAPYGQGIHPVTMTGIAPETEESAEFSSVADEQWEELRQAEQANAVIERGADVLSSDGEKIGEVDSVSFDPQTGRPTGFLVRHGILFSEDVEIPAGAVASVDDGVIQLKTDKERIDLWSRDSTVLLF